LLRKKAAIGKHWRCNASRTQPNPDTAGLGTSRVTGPPACPRLFPLP
jgi:hypothetical protein